MFYHWFLSLDTCDKPSDNTLVKREVSEHEGSLNELQTNQSDEDIDVDAKGV